jgi:hypothetical protein
VTEIDEMPCGGVIAVETPAYRPCADCQGIRLLCGAEQCKRVGRPPRAPVPPWQRPPKVPRPGPDGWQEPGSRTAVAQAEAPVREVPPGDEFAEFEAWLIAGGAGEKYARDMMKGARRCVQAGVHASADVTAERLPGLARSSLNIYRNAMKKHEQFTRERPGAPETAEATPEVDEAPETLSGPQERPQTIVFVNEGPAVREYPTVTPRETIAEVLDRADRSDRIEQLLCDIIDELRAIRAAVERPRVCRLHLTGEAFVIEEAPCP